MNYITKHIFYYSFLLSLAAALLVICASLLPFGAPYAALRDPGGTFLFAKQNVHNTANPVDNRLLFF